MSRSQRSQLPLGIHTLICTERAAAASQRAIIAICVLLLTVFSFKIFLPPLHPNFKMKLYTLTSAASLFCIWHHIVLPSTWVASATVGSQILKDGVNVCIKNIGSRKKSNQSSYKCEHSQRVQKQALKFVLPSSGLLGYCFRKDTNNTKNTMPGAAALMQRHKNQTT